MSRKVQSKGVAAVQFGTDVILKVGHKQDGKWFELISGGDIVDTGQFTTSQWNADIPATRAKAHGFAHVKLQAEKAEIDAIKANFERLGIVIQPSPVATPKSTLVQLVLEQKRQIDRRSSRPAPAAPKSTTLTTSFRGTVDSFDDDGFATTLLEDENGQHTEVRFSAEVLRKQRIGPGSWFTYRVYKTPKGGGYELEPIKPRKPSAAELAVSMRESQDLTAKLPEPRWDDSEE